MYAHAQLPASFARLLECVLIAIATGCGGDGSRTTGPGATGSLTVTVVQAGVIPASVHVTGPAGYTHSLTSTTTLSNVPVGTYTVSADSEEVADTIVGAAVFTGQLTGTPATVSRGETAQATVTYQFAHQRGALWLANYNGELVQDIGSGHLRSSATVVPQTQGFSVVPSGLAFDANGDLWVSAIYEDTLRMFTISDRLHSGTMTPSVKLQSPSLNTPEQMAFDRNGTLWVSDNSNGLVGFSAAQLAAGVSGVTAAFHIQDTLTDNPGMRAVAIDAGGNAWVAYGSANGVVEFSASQLTQSGNHAPVVRITPDSLFAPADLAFDSHGNLWAADDDNYGLVRYTPAQLAAGGAPGAIVRILTDYPMGIAFDNSGSMWVSDRAEALIKVFTPSQLTVSDRPTAAITLTVNDGFMSDVGDVAFDPWIVAAPTSSPSVTQNRASPKLTRAP